MGRRPQVAPGFTLLELIVTLAVLALAVAVVTPAIGRGTDGLRVRAEVAGFAATLRHAREQAITTQRPYRVVVDNDGHRLTTSTLPGPSGLWDVSSTGSSSTLSHSSGPSTSPTRGASSTASSADHPANVQRASEGNETRPLSSRLVVEPRQGSEVIFDIRGGASGGDFTLTSGSILYRVTVDRLTGRVRTVRE